MGIEVQASTYGQQVLAAVILAEARGEGEIGMRAVAEVIRRRADEKGKGILASLQPGDYSSLNGIRRDVLLKKFRWHPLFPDALRIAKLAYNSPQLLGNRTLGANHFTHKRERPFWTANRSPLVTIGNHAFYRIDG